MRNFKHTEASYIYNQVYRINPVKYYSKTEKKQSGLDT